MARDSSQTPDPALPGADIVRDGIADLRAGVESPAAMIVAEAAPRLRGLGLDVPRYDRPRPGHRLYELLNEAEGEGAHSRYKAYFRRMVSFCHAAESTGSGLATRSERPDPASSGHG